MNIKNKIRNMNRETKLNIIELTRGYVGAILLMILMWSGMVSGMYAGECLSVDLSEMDSLDNVVYTVAGNLSSLEGLTIELNGTIANICTVLNYKPDSFTIIFIDNSTKEIIKETVVYRGGSGGTSYVDRIVIQNETVYVPEYVNKEIEVERIIDNTIVLETGYELWHVLLAMALGGAFCWYVMRSEKKEDKVKEDKVKEDKVKEDLEMKEYE